MAIIVKFDNVTKYYKNQEIVKDISFNIEEKKLIVLIGPNGAGKTTIAKLILGLEKLSQGSIKRAKNIKYGYVPQTKQLNCNMPLTTRWLIKIVTNHKSTIDEYCKKLLKFTNINHIMDKQLISLSGGQLQRALLAANLMLEPDLLILDEPTQGLDIESQNQFYQLISEAKIKFSTSIFLISHDLNTIIDTADQVLCVNKHLCCYKEYTSKNRINKSFRIYTHKHDHSHNNF